MKLNVKFLDVCFDKTRKSLVTVNDFQPLMKDQFYRTIPTEIVPHLNGSLYIPQKRYGEFLKPGTEIELQW